MRRYTTATRIARRVARPTPPSLYSTACAVRARRVPSSNIRCRPIPALVRGVDITVKPDLGIWFAARHAIRPQSIAGIIPTYFARRNYRLDRPAPSAARTTRATTHTRTMRPDGASLVSAATAHNYILAAGPIRARAADSAAAKPPPLTAPRVASPFPAHAPPSRAPGSRARIPRIVTPDHTMAGVRLA